MLQWLSWRSDWVLWLNIGTLRFGSTFCLILTYVPYSCLLLFLFLRLYIFLVLYRVGSLNLKSVLQYIYASWSLSHLKMHKNFMPSFKPKSYLALLCQALFYCHCCLSGLCWWILFPPQMSAMLDGLTHVVGVMVDCINFSPYGIKYQPKNRCKSILESWSFLLVSFWFGWKIELMWVEVMAVGYQ